MRWRIFFKPLQRVECHFPSAKVIRGSDLLADDMRDSLVYGVTFNNFFNLNIFYLPQISKMDWSYYNIINFLSIKLSKQCK